VHNGHPKPNLRRKRRGTKWVGRQLEVVGLELMAESIMAGTHSKSRRERVPDYRSSNTETAGAK